MCVCTSQCYRHVCMSRHAFVALSAIPVIILTYCVTKRWTTVETRDGHTQKSSLKKTEVCFCDLKDNYALKLKCRPFHKRWLTFFNWWKSNMCRDVYFLDCGWCQVHADTFDWNLGFSWLQKQPAFVLVEDVTLVDWTSSVFVVEDMTLVDWTCSIFVVEDVTLVDWTCSIFVVEDVTLVDWTCSVFVVEDVTLVDWTCSIFVVEDVTLVDWTCSISVVEDVTLVDWTCSIFVVEDVTLVDWTCSIFVVEDVTLVDWTCSVFLAWHYELGLLKLFWHLLLHSLMYFTSLCLLG